MSDELAGFLQAAFLQEELCLMGDEPCGAEDCAACIYRAGATPRSDYRCTYPGLTA